MSQPPNPPSGGTPQQPGGWTPPGGPGNWQNDPTQQLPASPQYPPTQPLPAQDQFPGAYGPGQYGPDAPGGWAPPPGQYGSTGQYGATGQNGGPGQYGPPGGGFGTPPSGGGFGTPPSGGGYGTPPAGGSFGTPPPGGGYGAPPPGGNYGAPPSGGNFGAPPPPPPSGGGGGRNPLPVLIGIVAGVVVLGLAAWFLFLRPGGTATPAPSTEVSSPAQQSASATPSVLITPSAPPSAGPSVSTSPSARPSGSASASCSPDLSKTQCEWAVYLRPFVRIETCRLDESDRQRDAFVCTANARGKLKGTTTVSMRWANDSKDLTTLMDSFFSRAGVAKSKLGKNWKNPPAHTNWWYTDTPKQINGKLGSANAKDGSGRVAWTFSKQRFFVEAVSDGDNAGTVLTWWART